MSGLAAYSTLFVVAFVAATLLPAQSEAVLAGLVVAGQQPIWALLAVASLGNILGSLFNWLIGRGIEQYREKRWFPASPKALGKAQATYQRWGYWSLLASWVPIIGDPITLIAGVLREPLWRFLLLVSIAKVGRYVVVIALARQWL